VNTPATVPAEAELVRGTNGSVLGPVALKTRQSLLDALGVQLCTTPWRQLKVIDVSRLADVSPATFYLYFSSLEDAVLELAAVWREAGRRVTGHLARVVKLLDFEQDLAGRP